MAMNADAISTGTALAGGAVATALLGLSKNRGMSSPGQWRASPRSCRPNSAIMPPKSSEPCKGASSPHEA